MKKRIAELKAKAELTEAEKKELKDLEDAAAEMEEMKTGIVDGIKTALTEGLKGISGIITAKQAPVIGDPAVQGEKRSFGEVLKGIRDKNQKVIDKYKLISAMDYFPGEKTMGEDAGGGAGGFLVPVEYATKIIDLVMEGSVIRKIVPAGNQWPMKSNTLPVPTVTNGAIAYWTAENVGITPSDATFGQMVLTAYQLCVLSQVSNQLMADSNPKVDSVLYNIIAKAIIRGEETAFLQGTGVAPASPILGVYNAGIATIPYSGALLDDISELMGSIEEAEGVDISILHALREKKKLRNLKDDENQHIYQKPTEKNMPGTIWDANAYPNKYIPSNLGATANQSYMVAGDFNHAHIGDRQEIEIVADGSFFFNANATAIRAIKRTAFRLDDVTKFARLTGITRK